MRKKTTLYIAAASAALLIMPFTIASAGAVDIYVDPVNGSDNGAGSLDQPYKTISKAQAAVRSKNTSMKSDINIYLKGGVYKEDMLVFDEYDSGHNGFTVRWQAYENEKPIISGGEEIEGWSLYDADMNIYCADSRGIETRQLTVNGSLAQRARSEGSLLSDDAVYDNGVTGYTCSETEMLNWKNQSDIEFVYKNDWTNSRCPVDNIERGDNGMITVTMKQPAWRNVRVVKTGKLSVTQPWYVENAYELLDEPGEFYLDKSKGKIFYIPRDGEDMNSAEVIAGVKETVLMIKGKDLDNFVHDVTFDGISFRYSTWLRPGGEWGFADNQNATIRDTETGVRDLFPPAMVEAERARNVNFLNCEFAYAGSIGLKMTEGIDSCDVIGNHIYDCAAHGIVMGEITCQDKNNPRNNPEDIRLYMIRNKVNNNYIHNVAKDYKSAAAVSIGFLIDSDVSHNEIADVPYSAFHICYGFQTYSFEEGTVFRNVKITDNFIENTMNDELYDGGGIYILGASGGTEDNMIEVSGNYIKDQNDVYADIYLDNGSSYCKVFNNVIDQYSYPKGHSGDGNLYWVFANTESHGHRVYNSYINVPDVSRIHKDASDVTIQKPHIYLDNKWPDEALKIIDNAGLESEYKKKLGGIDRNVPDKIVSPGKVKLKTGETQSCDLVLYTVDGRAIDDAEISYLVKDSNVAAVSNGIFAGVSSGRTTVTAYATYNGKTVTKDIEVFVDDALADITLKNTPKNLFVGNKFILEAGFATKYNDDTIEDAVITYSTSDTSVITVDSKNFLIGIGEGEATLYITASTAEDTYTAQYPIKVYKDGAFRDMNYELMSVEDIIKDRNKWYIKATNPKGEEFELADGGVTKFRTYGSGYGIYTGEKYLNSVMDMNYKYNSVNGYAMLALRVQGEAEGPLSKADGSGCYLVVIKKDSIELQRVVKGVSNMIYGKLTTNSALGGERDNKLMPHLETLNVKFGAVNVDDGVVLSLVVDGQTVFEYFDNSPDAIRAPGHFGVVVWAGSLDLSAPTEDALRMSVAETRIDGTAYFKDTLAHWAINDIAYLAGKNILLGYDDGAFRPDGNITRAEFCTALSKCFDFEKKKYAAQFKDITGDEWYADDVYTALAAGIIPYEMQDEGNFQPERFITREEVAAMLYNASKNVRGKVMVQGDISNYSDSSDISPWAKVAVCGLVGEGLMVGDNEFLKPNSTITRAETAVILKRADGLIL